MTQKKSFKEDPALNFITPPTPAAETTTAPKTEPTSSPAPGTATSYKEMLKQVEARSKRLQCLIQPSLYDRVKNIADERGVSMNELIHSILEAFADKEGR
jgi:hypothetical protein